ncbi:MAG: hypothetical protein WDN47_00450 [Candidatus Doudnabacteria bacterium]
MKRLVALAFGSLFVAACSKEMQSPAAPAAPQPQATVSVLGTLSLVSCDDGGPGHGTPACTFSGIVRNNGPDCAAGIQGTTTVLVQFGGVAQSWSVNATLRPQETTQFTVFGFSQGEIQTGKPESSASARGVTCP